MVRKEVTRVRCTHDLNFWSGHKYRYLRTGREYPVDSQTGTCYRIRTPRGLTHYPKKNFTVIDDTLRIYEYHPSQEGDRDDDI